MNVRVEVELISSATEADREDMFSSAKYLSNNETSIVVYIPDDKPDSVVVEFTIDKARQIDVVDKIGRRFRNYVENYSQSSISFPKNPARKAQQSRIQYTHKQGQYLAFIYYYTKLNGYPPAEADMQKYFKTTPPAVHGMVVQLEKKGFIEKKPNEPRSIRLLLSREELPDLE
jgi:DNA-binding MarR family transcriptional regulator